MFLRKSQILSYKSSHRQLFHTSQTIQKNDVRMQDDQRKNILDELAAAKRNARNMDTKVDIKPEFDYSHLPHDVMYRTMDAAELLSIINNDKIGNDPNPGIFDITMRRYNLFKRPHFNMPEHVQKSNSRLLYSLSYDPFEAARYAGVGFKKGDKILVATKRPLLTCSPADHAIFDRAPFDYFHEQYLQERHNEKSDGVVYSTTGREKNAAILCKDQREIAMIISSPCYVVDFRPHFNECIIALYHMNGGGMNYAFTHSEPFYVNQHAAHRSYAFQVVCPTGIENYKVMNQAACAHGLMPGDFRLLTFQDVVELHQYMRVRYPAEVGVGGLPQEVIQYVPAKFEIGSMELLEYMLEQHEQFRAKHGYCNPHERIYTRGFGVGSSSE